MRRHDFHWLAGLLEGEGCFSVSKKGKYAYPKISLNMTDRDVVLRASKLLQSTPPCRVKNKGGRDTYQTNITGSRALVMMRKLMPFMGTRRRARIKEIQTEVGAAYTEKMTRLGRA